MNKSAIKKMLAVQFKAIASAESTIDMANWERSKSLSEIQGMVVWQKSPCLSFAQFVREELPQYQLNTVYAEINKYRHMSKYFTWGDLLVIAKSVGFSRTYVASRKLTGPVSIKAFIKMAKALVIQQKRTLGSSKANTVTNDNRITLQLTQDRIYKLELILMKYGYNPTPGQNKHGISEAFAKLLDTL